MWTGRKQSTSDPVDLVPAHLKARYIALSALPVSEPAAPWRKVTVAAVGGLTAIGFAADSDLLLVTSFDGRGLFDCLSGARIARDDEFPFPDDLPNCRAEGIGPLTGQMLHVAGIHGGGLSTWAGDWSLEVLPLSWPNEKLLLFPASKTMWDDRQTLDGVVKLDINPLRAFGFSPTGRSFAVATSSDVTIYSL